MMDSKLLQRIRRAAVIGVFALALIGVALWQAFLPDAARSSSERRPLAQAPTFTFSAMFKGSYAPALESYLLDQFPARDTFRSVKALLAKYGLMKLDNNGYYQLGDALYKLDNGLDESQLDLGVQKVNTLLAQYGDRLHAAYFSVIPEKSAFVAADAGYPVLDHAALIAALQGGIQRAAYIDLTGALTADSYYRTDTHWRQESLQPVVDTLLAGMGQTEAAPDLKQFTAHTLDGFSGVYLGQAALPVAPDTLTYLSSPAIDAATVTSAEKPDQLLPVYQPELFTQAVDGYDVFLGGATACLTIQSPHAATDRELVIFRDSFGSSVAPLLLETYAKVTLVDLRYMSSALLDEYVSFDQADVLFLWSASVWNAAGLLK